MYPIVYTCTMSETNVTTISINAVSGSIRNPSAILTSPVLAHTYRSPLNVLPASTSRKITTDAANEIATAMIVIQCDAARGILLPHKPTMMDAASGTRGTTRYSSCIVVILLAV